MRKARKIALKYIETIDMYGHNALESFVNADGQVIQLDCMFLDVESMLDQNVPRFLWKRGTDELPFELWDAQYDMRFNSFTNLGYPGRPSAKRIPFLLADLTPEKFCSLTLSHLCHNDWCWNYRHHILESLPDNKGRNGCPGGQYCHHIIPCIRPGKYFQGLSSVALDWDTIY